jgi:membrane associated rhomboid family serine protease
LVLGYWFVLQFLSGAAGSITVASQRSGVAFWAHVGGFLTGMALIKVMPVRKQSYAFEED